MKLEKQVTDQTLTIMLEGRLDTTTSPELEKMLEESLEGITELVMDFQQLVYISSAGLRVLLAAQKKMNHAAGSMRILHVNQNIMEIFEITGFVDILTIED